MDTAIIVALITSCTTIASTVIAVIFGQKKKNLEEDKKDLDAQTQAITDEYEDRIKAYEEEIAKLRAKLRLGPAPSIDTKGEQDRLSALDAAAKLLSETGQAMRAKEMIAAMAEKRYWKSPGGKTPDATLAAAIYTEIKKRGPNARFKKTEPGKFALNGQAPPSPGSNGGKSGQVVDDGKTPPTRLRVRFGDGRVIAEPTAAATFALTIQRLGLARVAALDIVKRIPLIDDKKHPIYQQSQIDGKYICTHSATDEKKELLEEIAKRLGDHLEVEIVPTSG